MFAPHTTHLTRSYAAPTTRRRVQVHDENTKSTLGLPAKTPSRTNLDGLPGKAVLANTGGPARLGLGARTEGKDRNVLTLGRTPGGVEGGAGKGGGKGKGKEGDDIAPKRLFANPKLAPSTSFSSLQPIVHPKSHARTNSTFTSSTSIQNPHKTPARAPPTTRKPVQNTLRTPAPPTAFRIARDTPPALPAVSTPLASAQREHRRRSSRSSLTLSITKSVNKSRGSLSGPGLGPGSVKHSGSDAKEFKTPVNGRWAEEDSMDDIQPQPHGQGEEGQGEVGLDVLAEDEEEESDGEIEYMPPKITVPFDAGFEYPRFDPSEIIGPESDCEAGPVTPDLTLMELPLISMVSDEDLEDPIFRTVPPTPPETAMEPLVKAAAGTTQKTARPGQARMASPGATSSGAVRPAGQSADSAKSARTTSMRTDGATRPTQIKSQFRGDGVKGSVRFAPSVTAPRSAPSSALRTTQSGAMDASRTATTDTAVRTTKPGLPAAARASRPLPQGPVSVSASASGSVSASRTVAPGAIGSKTAISAPDNRTIPRSAAQRLRAPGPSAPGARSAIRAASANASSIPKQARVEGGEAGEGETDVQRMQREMDEDMCELGGDGGGGGDFRFGGLGCGRRRGDDSTELGSKLGMELAGRRAGAADGHGDKRTE